MFKYLGDNICNFGLANPFPKNAIIIESFPTFN